MGGGVAGVDDAMSHDVVLGIVFIAAAVGAAFIMVALFKE